MVRERMEESCGRPLSFDAAQRVSGIPKNTWHKGDVSFPHSGGGAEGIAVSGVLKAMSMAA
jgi:hypothetical protein